MRLIATKFTRSKEPTTSSNQPDKDNAQREDLSDGLITLSLREALLFA